MISWVTSWWTSGAFSGPARNAPNEGKNIKAFFDQRPRQVIVVTDVEIQNIRKCLKKAQTNTSPPKSHKPPIMKELDTVFEQGQVGYFETVRKRREEAKMKVTQNIMMIITVQSITKENKMESIGDSESIEKSIEETIKDLESIEEAIGDSESKKENNFPIETSELSSLEFTKEEINSEMGEFQNM